jgi:hypothetical protein
MVAGAYDLQGYDFSLLLVARLSYLNCVLSLILFSALIHLLDVNRPESR